MERPYVREAGPVASGGTLASHKGLTFGGWLLSRRIDATAFDALWTQFLALCRADGYDTIIYRPSPHIYHRYPCEEDLYTLWRSGAELSARLASSVAPVADGTAVFDMACRQSVRKAAAKGVTVQLSDDYAAFWQLLEARLHERYGATPVHTLAEIELLHSRFPDNIRLYTAMHDDRLLGGIVMYLTDTAAHSQYTATSAEGRDMRVVPLIYSRILDDLAAAGIRWMDYGTSNEDGGRLLNEGLLRQKAGFGARLIAYDTYTLHL